MLRALRTGEFADTGQRYPGFAYNGALQVASTQHAPIAYPRAGTVWQTDDGLTLTFIGPSLPLLTHTRNGINNNSLAFILQYGNFRMLFTGDAGAESERRFLAGGIDLHADVLKVGHHGSAYGSTAAFVNAVHPRMPSFRLVAIISSATPRLQRSKHCSTSAPASIARMKAAP